MMQVSIAKPVLLWEKLKYLRQKQYSWAEPILLFSTYFSFQQFFFFLPILLAIFLPIKGFSGVSPSFEHARLLY